MRSWKVRFALLSPSGLALTGKLDPNSCARYGKEQAGTIGDRRAEFCFSIAARQLQGYQILQVIRALRVEAVQIDSMLA